MLEPKYQEMVLTDAARRERRKAEAARLKLQARLPPRMEQHAAVAELRKSKDLERIKAEAA